MYGIANCDTIKKAKKWLTDNNIEFDFHDYKKQGVDKSLLQKAIAEQGIDTVVNKRGTTYRKLSDVQKQNLDESNVIDLLVEQPSMIKRPILVHNTQLLVGFNAPQYQECFGLA